MCHKYFPVVTGHGGAITTIYTVRYFSPLGPNLGVGPPPVGHKIHLRGRKMINGAGNKKKQ